MMNLYKIIKRSLDIFFALFGLTLLTPIIFLSYLFDVFETLSNGFFIHKRVGLNGHVCSIVKIKTMKSLDGINSTITSCNDVRIAKSDIFFRKTKIDELPQLWNILISQMSFVGPRSDVIGYADRLKGKDKISFSQGRVLMAPLNLVIKMKKIFCLDKRIWLNTITK